MLSSGSGDTRALRNSMPWLSSSTMSTKFFPFLNNISVSTLCGLQGMFLGVHSFYFDLDRYSMDLRKYLKKHHDQRKLNEILL